MKEVQIYDTTLRDGAQAEGVSFSVEDKLRIVQELDTLGIHYIEGGYAGANPKDEEFFKRVRELKLNKSKVTAFGSTRKAGKQAFEDKNLQHLISAEADVITIVGKSWDLHVKDVLKVSKAENLKMIEDSIQFLVKNGREVIFDAEHFFDGYKSNPEYAMETLISAINGGASYLILCDTNGGTMPL
ncbi:MAG: citramalate synthase, partial [Candidatus Poribacteria bacterium]